MKQWDMNSTVGKGVILDTIDKNPGVTIPELKELLQSKSVKVYGNVTDLLKSGYLRREFREHEFMGINVLSTFFITPEGKNALEKVISNSTVK